MKKLPKPPKAIVKAAHISVKVIQKPILWLIDHYLILGMFTSLVGGYFLLLHGMAIVNVCVDGETTKSGCTLLAGDPYSVMARFYGVHVALIAFVWWISSFLIVAEHSIATYTLACIPLIGYSIQIFATAVQQGRLLGGSMLVMTILVIVAMAGSGIRSKMIVTWAYRLIENLRALLAEARVTIAKLETAIAEKDAQIAQLEAEKLRDWKIGGER